MKLKFALRSKKRWKKVKIWLTKSGPQLMAKLEKGINLKMLVYMKSRIRKKSKRQEIEPQTVRKIL